MQDAIVKLTVNFSFERNCFGNIAFKAKFDYAREGTYLYNFLQHFPHTTFVGRMRSEVNFSRIRTPAD